VTTTGSIRSSGEDRPVETSDAHPAQWQTQTVYKVGDQAKYNDITYVCIQAHTSVEGWEPPKTPALWVRVIKDDPDRPPTPDVDLFQYRRRSLLLPLETDVKSIISSVDDHDTGKKAEEREKSAKSLLARHENLSKAVNELTAIDPKYFQTLEQKPHGGVEVQDEYTSIRLQTQQLGLQKVLRELNVDQFKAAADRSGRGPVISAADAPAAAAAAAAPAASQVDPLQLQDVGGAVSALGLTRELLAPPTGLRSKRKFEPQAASALTLKLKAEAPVSEGTQSLLKEKGIQAGSIPLPGKRALPLEA
jgi:hypothetical protein